MFYTFHLWKISFCPQSVSLALISYPYNLCRMYLVIPCCFFHLGDSFYLYLKPAHPPQTSLTLCPDPGSVWNSLFIYLCGPRPLPYPFMFSHSWSWYCCFQNYVSITLDWHTIEQISLRNSSHKNENSSRHSKLLCFFFFFQETTQQEM